MRTPEEEGPCLAILARAHVSSEEASQSRKDCDSEVGAFWWSATLPRLPGYSLSYSFLCLLGWEVWKAGPGPCRGVHAGGSEHTWPRFCSARLPRCPPGAHSHGDMCELGSSHWNSVLV